MRCDSFLPYLAKRKTGASFGEMRLWKRESELSIQRKNKEQRKEIGIL
jgi:hypothetical protein